MPRSARHISLTQLPNSFDYTSPSLQQFQDEFEAKLESFISANGCSQEQLLSLLQAAEHQRASTSAAGCGIASVIISTLEYDVFLEMVRMVKRRQRA